MRLVIYFDGQFWIGLIERNDEKGFYASRHIFGAEPKDGEIFSFVQTQLVGIIDSQKACAPVDEYKEQKLNPKRLLKLAHRAAEENPVSTKSQDALRVQMEADKKERVQLNKEQRDEINEYKRLIAKEKKKQKHKGR